MTPRETGVVKPVRMPATNDKIDRQLRRQALRKALVITASAVIFVGFMSYALDTEYGPGAEIVDYFPEANRTSE